MKIKSFLIAVFLIFSALSDSGQPQAATEDLILEPGVVPHKGLDQVYRRFSEGYRRLDAGAVANLYTETAAYLAPGGEVRLGRQKILDVFSRFFDSVRKQNAKLEISFRILQRQADQNLAYDVGIYTLTSTSDKDGRPRRDSGKFVVVARRDAADVWRIQVDGYNDLPAAQNSRTAPLDSRNLADLLDPIFAEQMEKLRIPGAAVSVVKDGKIVFAKGYGVADLDKKTAVTAEKTIFRIGSITKVFTATAVVQMADRGKLDLGDDVNKYLKGVRVPDTFPQPITFAHLLTHTAGLDEISPGRRTSDRTQVIPLGAFLKNRIVRHLPPGEIISYGTYNSALAAHAVEQITQTPFKSYLLENIFEPLAMQRTSISEIPENLLPDLAAGYEYAENRHQKLPFQWFHTYPASDINSTATDMARFMIAHLQYGQLDGKRILSANAARRMQATQFRNHPQVPGWAYGFYEGTQNGLRFVEHGGSMDDGYSALLTLVPEKNFGIFVACNTESGGFGLAGAVKNAVLNRFFPAPPHSGTPLLPTTKNPAPEALQKFAGKFKPIIYCHTCAPNTAYNPEPVEVKVTDDGMLSFGRGRWKQIEPLLFVLADGPQAGQVLLGFKENKKGEIAFMFHDSYRVFEKAN